MKHIVVTGGAGFIGSHVVEYYSGKKLRVTAVDNMSRAKLLHKKTNQPSNNAAFVDSLPNVRLIREDVRNFNAMQKILADADAVVHTAGQTAVTTSMVDPLEDFSVNAMGTMCVLEAARRSPKKPAVIYTSTNKVYGSRVNRLGVKKAGNRYIFDAAHQSGVAETLGLDLCEHTPYGCSKLSADVCAQDFARLYGMKVGLFRMSCIYGTRQYGFEDQGWLAWFIIATVLGKPITIFGDGRQVRDVLYVEDLVCAFDAFLCSDIHHEVFNIGGGVRNTLSLLELLDIIEKHTGRRMPVSFKPWRPSDQKVYISNINKVSRMLRWKPLVSPEEGVARMVEWVQANRFSLENMVG